MSIFRKFSARIGVLLPALAILAFLAPGAALAESCQDKTYDVRILRDSWGVPHIFGKTDADASYGLAYAQCEDDFETLQGTLLAARGVLASVFGAKAALNDGLVQMLRIWDDVNAQYETDLSADTRALCEAYAAGVNYYAELHPDEVIGDYLPVTGKDIIAGFVHKIPLFFGLPDALGELMQEEQQRIVSAKSGEQAFLPGRKPDPPVGSNMIGVAPSRSADGKTRLAINSHQPWTGPVAWYEAHMHSEEGLDIVGGTFPGGPLILHGHNRDLGWAHTVNNPDLIDIYQLEIDEEDPYRYKFDGEWKELEVREAKIKVKLLGPISWTFKREMLWSVYGPTLRAEHGTYSFRYAGMGNLKYLEQLYRMNKAENLDQFLDAMRVRGLVMMNTGYADKEGNIYYVFNAALPIRSEDYDWQQYLPGNTSETLWTEYLPYDKLPQVLNPKAGFFINSNGSPFYTTAEGENPNPDDFSKTLGIETYSWNRELRAMELYGGDESITAEEFYDYKYDMAYSENSRFAKMVRKVLAAPAPEDPLLQEALVVLRAWDLRTNPDNTSAALGVMTTYRALNNWGYTREDIDPNLDVIWDALEKAARMLKEEHGRINVAWSEVNRLRRGDTDLGIGGGPHILHAVYGTEPNDAHIYGRAGDSYILMAEWGEDGVKSQSIHQFGSATMDETSPHYADQAHLFVKRMMKPVWMDEADILANLEREYRPGE